MKLCNECYDKVGFSRCGKCHKVRYCSRECQIKAWPSHRLFCYAHVAAIEKPPTFLPPLPPLDDFKRRVKLVKYIDGLLFPENEISPCFVKVPVVSIYTRFKETLVVPYINYYTQDEDNDTKYLNYKYRGPQAYEVLPDAYMYHFRDNFLADGSKPNKSIAACTRGKHKHGWRGPMVVVKMVGNNAAVAQYNMQNLTIKDCADLLAFFYQYGEGGGGTYMAV